MISMNIDELIVENRYESQFSIELKLSSINRENALYYLHVIHAIMSCQD